MVHTSREHATPQHFDARKTPRPDRGRQVPRVIIVIAALLAVLLLLAGSPGGAFVSGLVAGSVWLAQYFHAVATRSDQDH